MSATQSEGLCLSAQALHKVFETGYGTFPALNGVSLDVHKGEFIGISGRSGSGKSTLINLLCGLDRGSSGTIWSSANGGQEITALNEEELALWRGRFAGIVFQFFQLLPSLSVLDNVLLPMDLCNTHQKSQRRDRAMALLQELGIAEHAQKLPLDISGGQQQRTAIARALANDPDIIFADEPTGNLDSASASTVMELFARQCTRGKAVVMVTHDVALVPHFSRIITLNDGQIVSTEQAA